jgi:hypothetical protein
MKATGVLVSRGPCKLVLHIEETTGFLFSMAQMRKSRDLREFYLK